MQDTSDLVKELLLERCEATHEAIREGRTNLTPYGTQESGCGDVGLDLYVCPHCKTTVSRRRSA
jgi:hypothetical protein